MNEQTMIPYVAHDGMMVRQERTVKRLWILCIILTFLLVISNAAWIHYEQQWETAKTVVTQDVDTVNGGDAIIYDGVRVNGTCETDGNGENP